MATKIGVYGEFGALAIGAYTACAVAGAVPSSITTPNDVTMSGPSDHLFAIIFDVPNPVTREPASERLPFIDAQVRSKFSFCLTRDQQALPASS
jgi:hypothetical protein